MIDAPIERIDVPPDSIAYRRLGEGPPLVLIHGWPFHGLSFRHLAPLLAPHFTCYALDLPGTGETGWNPGSRFAPRDLARSVSDFIDALALERPALLAYDTGATVARFVAAERPSQISALVMGNTEIPGHRPASLLVLQKFFHAPLAGRAFRTLLRSDRFCRSPYGLGLCFYDRSRIDNEFKRLFVDPLVLSARRTEGYLRYARAIDWDQIDELEDAHREITAPVLIVWGERGKYFPVEEARRMAPQFKTLAAMHEIPRARLLVHEEHPKDFARLALPFLLASTS